jgi:pimeloyl-ACP methyl ester carboxylesterase
MKHVHRSYDQEGEPRQGPDHSFRRQRIRPEPDVAVVQNPTLSLQGDAAATRLIVGAQDGPVVLVGHSYGGAVITEAGTGQNVAALAYICAFAPYRGSCSVSGLRILHARQCISEQYRRRSPSRTVDNGLQTRRIDRISTDGGRPSHDSSRRRA